MKFALIGGSYKTNDPLPIEDELVIKEVLLELPKSHLAIIALRSAGYTQHETAILVMSSRTSVGTVERAVTNKFRVALEGG